ncbi:MAG: c-type cytochrome [Vulcanimicrobiaceae bacterium]
MRVSGLLFIGLILGLAACSGRGHQHHTPTASVGERLYDANCAVCHGAGGTGTRIGPSLIHVRERVHAAGLQAIVLDPTPPMPRLVPGRLSHRDVVDIVAYLQTL